MLLVNHVGELLRLTIIWNVFVLYCLGFLVVFVELWTSVLLLFLVLVAMVVMLMNYEPCIGKVAILNPPKGLLLWVDILCLEHWNCFRTNTAVHPSSVPSLSEHRLFHNFAEREIKAPFGNWHLSHVSSAEKCVWTALACMAVVLSSRWYSTPNNVVEEREPRVHELFFFAK